MQAFHRDRLLYSKETNALSTCGKGSKTGKMMRTAISPIPLESSEKNPKHQATEKRVTANQKKHL